MNPTSYCHHRFIFLPPFFRAKLFQYGGRREPRAATINHRHFTVAINSQIMKSAIGDATYNTLLNAPFTKVDYQVNIFAGSPGTKCSTQQIILNLETAMRKTYFQLILTENRETNKESEKRGQHSLIM